MRTIYRPECVRRIEKTDTDDLAAWARSVIADPAAHCATPAEAGIVATLLAELEVAR